MTYIYPLSEEEETLLKQHYRKSQCRLIRERAHAVLLSSKGRSIADIALILMRNEATIRQWLNDFNKKRIASIFHKYEGNINASKLTVRQREEIKQTLQSPPSEKGLPKEFWDVPSLKEYLKGEFSVVYESDRSYHYLLRFSGFSFKLPTPFDIKRDKDQINHRLLEIHKEIRPYLEDDQWEVLAADEARLERETEIRRAWLKRNAKTIIKVHRDRQYQNFLGALNLKKHTAQIIRLNWQNTQEIIRAIEELLKSYPNKKICVIWDNVRWHKAKMLRQKLKKGLILEHIHLINFPPYAPDVNPQEQVWKFGKGVLSNSSIFDDFEQKIDNFENSIRNRIFEYKIPEFVLR